MQFSSQPRVPGMKTLAPNATGFGAVNAAAPADALDRYVRSQSPLAPNTGYGTLNPHTTIPGTTSPVTPRAPAAADPNTSGSGSGAAKTPAAPANAFDLSTDPIVQKIRALNTANYGDAVAGADAQRKGILVDSGFGDLARAAQFGSLENPTTGDEATALAAAQNPFSTAAQLLHQHETAGHAIDQNANDANLFYSSTRANQLGDEGHAYLQNEYDAENNVRSQLAQIIQGLVDARSTGRNNEENALETARQNAINIAIAQGGKFAGYDANGNPIITSNDSAAPSQLGPPSAPGIDAYASGGQPDPFANLANLTPADWAKLAAPKSKSSPPDAIGRAIAAKSY